MLFYDFVLAKKASRKLTKIKKAKIFIKDFDERIIKDTVKQENFEEIKTSHLPKLPIIRETEAEDQESSKREESKGPALIR